MKDLPLIQLVEMNAKHVHTNLALRYFRQHLSRAGIPADLCTLNINQDIRLQLMRLVGQSAEAPRIVLFSIYIWNVEQMLQLAKALKSIAPQTFVVFGGPEVSFHGEAWLKAHPQVDLIVSGEGEGFIAAWIEAIDDGKGYQWLTQMSGKSVAFEAISLDTLGIGYTQEELAAQHILYYEASRGCPFSCAFCMSARESRLRYKSLEVVSAELAGFIQGTHKIVKLIDRTFNAPMARALSLLELFAKIDEGTVTFHLEVSPTGLTDEFIDAVARLRPGLVQFEVGIQSTTETTLKAISRAMPEAALEQVKRLCALENCHTHVDLIAGLPEDTLETFTKAIDKVLYLKPDHLQLGMLKLLNGAPLKAQAQQYDYRYADWPPYEFFSNHTLSYSDKLRLECVEEGLERLHNVEQWPKSLMVLHRQLEAPWRFYEVLGREILEKGLSGYKLSQDQVLACAIRILEPMGLSKDFEVSVVLESWLKGVTNGQISRTYLREADSLAHTLIRQLQETEGSPVDQLPVKQLAKAYRAVVLTVPQYQCARDQGILPMPKGTFKQNALPTAVLLFRLNPSTDYYLVETV